MEKTMKLYKAFLYIEAMLVYLLACIGGFGVETFLGYKMYGEIYITRTVSMIQNPLYATFCGIAFAFLGVVVALKVAKPWVDNMLALENS